MWNMYTPNMKGVRIKMKTFPFKKYPRILYKKDETDTYINESLLKRKDYWEAITSGLYLLEVKYTDDEKLLFPKIQDEDSFSSNYHDVGRYKRKCWEFQSEWRYRIIFLPIDMISSEEFWKNKIEYINKIPFNEFYLELAEDAFEGCEILLGPKTTEADRIIVESLVDRYQGNKNILISRSKLSVRM